jgi:uncharacterized protein YpmB
MKSKKGISLIVLVITIIVIIILAGAVILSLSNNNPIAQANKVTYLSDIRNFQSELDLYEAKQYSDNLGVYDPTLLQADAISVTYNGTKDTSKNINNLIPSLKTATNYAGQFAVISGKLVYQGSDTNKQIWSTGAGFTVQIPNKTYSGATTGFTYNNPVIPVGFVAVNTTDANWNNLSTDWNKGLVIQDASGNQFVWVPVDGTSVTYSKWCTAGISNALTTDDTLPSGVTNETTQINTYGGFYIARYESMFDYNSGSIRVASKKSTNKTIENWSTTRTLTYNGYLWNYISYTQAKTYSESMCTSYGYTAVKTGLLTGTQWDTIMEWIKDSGKSVIDSATWGNHSNSVSPANVTGYGNLQISGYSEYWKAKNIYDIAGNTLEWITEKYNSDAVGRGGSYTYSGSDHPASCRISGPINNTLRDISFRIVLYIL